MFSRRRAIIVITLALLAVFALVLHHFAQPPTPFVRLISITPNTLEKVERNSIFDPIPASALPDSTTWKAQFEIHVPFKRGMFLAQGEIPYQILGPNNNILQSGHCPDSLPSFVLSSLALEITRPTLRLPPDAHSVRFTIKYSVPGWRYRTQRFLEEKGIQRRFPKLVRSLTRNLPNKERWLVCEKEVPISISPSELK